MNSIETIWNASASDTDKAKALVLYLDVISGSNVSSSSANNITIQNINEIVDNLNISYVTNSSEAILMATQPDLSSNDSIALGLIFPRSIDGAVVSSSNIYDQLNHNFSVGSNVGIESLDNVTSFNMLIISDATTFQNADNTSNRKLVSSIVVATINPPKLDRMGINISLYFRDLNRTPPKGHHLCAFFDTITSQWNSSGCSTPEYKKDLDRYECVCKHLTSFALVWLPDNGDGMRIELSAQDIASIVFQVVSIICFLAIIIHGIVVHFKLPQKFVLTRLLLTLIACGITMILFVFYIALVSTVYSRHKQSDVSNGASSEKEKTNFNEDISQNKLDSRADQSSNDSNHESCQPEELGLMFIVYFVLLFMFGVKTSYVYYYYRYYVQLFPLPTPRTLGVNISISFLIAIIFMACAAGVNSKGSYRICEIHGGKICWFSTKSIHYFLTMPICIFLAISIFWIILIAKGTLDYTRYAPQDSRANKRLKEYLIVLLTSCMTLGLGWIFGPLILITNPGVAKVLGWIFVIFNGSEGLWGILLYYAALRGGMNERGHSTDNGIDDYRSDDSSFSRPESRSSGTDRQPSPIHRFKSASPRNSTTSLSLSSIRYRIGAVENDK